MYTTENSSQVLRKGINLMDNMVSSLIVLPNMESVSASSLICVEMKILNEPFTIIKMGAMTIMAR
jgi:hypothetical protein